MSKAVTALGGVRASGYVAVREAPLQGMVTLRADLKAPEVASALTAVMGAKMPKVRMMTQGSAGTLAWMSPDELLLLVAYDEAEAIAASLTEALKGLHALVSVVSDARAMFELEGDKADEIIAKLAPVDTARLANDEMRRTRLAQVPAALWRTDKGINLICFRSVAQYAFDLLRTSAMPGSEVF